MHLISRVRNRGRWGRGLQGLQGRVLPASSEFWMLQVTSLQSLPLSSRDHLLCVSLSLFFKKNLLNLL